MNFSENNEQGLLSLVTALRAGMDPSMGYQVLGDIQNQQASMVAQRQERLGGLADLLMGAAGQGMDYEGANALMEAAPGPAGPAAQNILSSLYPTGGPQSAATPMSASGQPLDPASIPGYQAHGAQATSPVMAPPPPPSDTMQLAMAEQQQTAAADADWGVFQQFMAQARAKEIDPQTAYTMWVQQGPENASLVASDQARVKGILGATFGQAALLGVAQ
jgi:hypothetical protein